MPKSETSGSDGKLYLLVYKLLVGTNIYNNIGYHVSSANHQDLSHF